MTLTLLDPSIVDELTRRGFLAGGLGTAALLGLGAFTSFTDFLRNADVVGPH